MILKRSLVSELANVSGGVFTVLFAIVLAVGMVQILGLAAGGRVDSASVLQMVLYNLLTNLAPLLTLALFVSVLMVMLRWWQDNEMVVWFSSGGCSLASLISPVLRFALPVVACVALLSLVISPWSRSQDEILRAQFKNRDEVNAIAPGRFIETNGGKRVFFIESAGAERNKVGRVFLADSDGKNDSLVMASSAQIESNSEGDRYVVLHDGRRYESSLSPDSAKTRIFEFKNYDVRIDIKLDQPLRASRAASQPLTFLLEAPTNLNLSEVVRRLCWPLAAFNLALFAVPLSCTSPRGGRALNIIMGALIFILYMNAISITETWISQGKIGPWTGLIGLNGGVFIFVVLLYLRKVYLLRTLPAWCSPWYWHHRRRQRKALNAQKENVQ